MLYPAELPGRAANQWSLFYLLGVVWELEMGLMRRVCERLCNAFGVTIACWFGTQGAPFDKLRANLGFGVVPRCGTSDVRAYANADEKCAAGLALGASVGGAHEVVGVLEGDDAEEGKMAGGEGAFDFEVEVVAGGDGFEEMG
jgi:hypothetical protein